MRKIPGAVDVHVHQIMNQPALRIEVDRTRAAQLGLHPAGDRGELPDRIVLERGGHAQLLERSEDRSAVSGRGGAAAPHCARFRRSGAQHPVAGQGLSRRRRRWVTWRRSSTPKLPAIINHVNTELAFDVYANVQGTGSRVASQPTCARSSTNSAPRRRSRRTTRASNLPARQRACTTRSLRMGIGLIAAVLLVYFLMVINFQSWTDPFIIITALPGAVLRNHLDAVLDRHELQRALPDGRDHERSAWRRRTVS